MNLKETLKDLALAAIAFIVLREILALALFAIMGIIIPKLL